MVNGANVSVKVGRVGFWDVWVRKAKWTDWVWMCDSWHIGAGMHVERDTVRGFEPSFLGAMKALRTHVYHVHGHGGP